MSTVSTSPGVSFVLMKILSTVFEKAVLKIAAAAGKTAQRTISTLKPVTETSREAESAMLKTSLITIVIRYPAVPKSGTRP